MKFTLLAFVLLLGTSWVSAQTSAAASQEGSSHESNPEGSEQTVTGCLGQSNGQYTLVRKNGIAYKLSRDSEQLSGYVGQEVRITGMVVAKSGSNGTQEANGTGGTAETLRVHSVKHISNTCPSAEGEMAK
jgi:hypothetical protein